MKARATPSKHGDWSVKPVAHQPVDWDRDSQESVRDGIDHLQRIVSEFGEEIAGLAIASYGPFESLAPGDSYGCIHPDVADEPLKGLHLFKTFASCFQENWLNREDTSIQVQTDANACALGEAYLQGLTEDQVLAYLLATDGIGVGLVRGRNVLQSALHPEIGLLPAYMTPGDPMVPSLQNLSESPFKFGGFYDFPSIAEFCNNKALQHRYAMMNRKTGGSSVDLNDEKLQFSDELTRETFWELRASYLAQACVACVGIMPPHKIVVAPDIDPLADTVRRVWKHVKAFRDGWNARSQPLLNFDEFDNGYIKKPSGVIGFDGTPPSAVTGAIGLCYLAARDEVPGHRLN